MPVSSVATVTGATSRPTVGAYTGLDPLLAEFEVLYRASSFTGVDGEDWLNEGTAGHGYDAEPGTVLDNPATTGVPHYVTTPEPGFEIPGDSSAYYCVRNGSGIEPGTGSFTAFARTYWPAAAGADGNICAKITGTPTVNFAGYRMASGDNWGGITIALIGNGGTALTYAFSPGNLGSGEHLLVMRVDRAADTIDIFVDGVKGTTGVASVISDVTCNHEWIFGRGKAQTNRDYGLRKRALTDTEITVDLPTALGV